MESPAVSYFRSQPDVVQALRATQPDEVLALKASQRFRAALPSAERLRQFLIQSAELRELESILHEPNLFAALGITEKEIRHSRVLGWLLDPMATHGEGTTFLERFLKAALESNGESLEDYEIELQEAVVECEDDGIDILVVMASSKFVLAIENKLQRRFGHPSL